MTQQMHAGRILFNLARHFNWFQNRMISEFDVGTGLREDLVVVSRAGYATVIEIKVTRADWQADRHKNRWPSERIRRFFYCVPYDLFKRGIPKHVPDFCGVLTVRPSKPDWHGYDTVCEERAARVLKAKKLEDRQLAAIDGAFYYRFWRQHMDLERRRLVDLPRAA